MCALLAGAAVLVSGSVLQVRAEICSDASVPEVRFCGVEEFCCGKACCPRSMLYFFKLSVAVVLIVLILVWLCNYLRRGSRRRHEPQPGLGPHSVTSGGPMTPPPYDTSAMQAQMRCPYPLVPSQLASARPVQNAQHTTTPAAQDDLPPPYHMVVNMTQPPAPPYSLPNTQLPPYDASTKTTSGPP